MSKTRVISTAAEADALGRGMIFLAAFVSFALSVSLWFSGHHDQAVFVGLWVPSILALGGLVHGRSR